jgi:hypothetical protein
VALSTSISLLLFSFYKVTGRLPQKPKRAVGRPRKYRDLSGGTYIPKKAPGRPPKLTHKEEAQWVRAIDRIKRNYENKYGEPLSDAKALRMHMVRFYTRQFIADGDTAANARRRAHALDIERAFRSLKVRLSQARGRLRAADL